MQKRSVALDALRGFVMFMMIFVNDLAGAGAIVPDWMMHYHDRNVGSGMTFVDVVFPAFLFVVGMSIPYSLEPRIVRGDSMFAIGWHVASRTLALLVLGVLMVNKPADTALMGYSATLWATLFYISAICAFCVFTTHKTTEMHFTAADIFTIVLRLLGIGTLVFLAITYVGADGHRIITLDPLSIHHSWWGILGLIGWAYLIASLVFLSGVGSRGMLVSGFALMCLYPLSKMGVFSGWWIAEHINIGAALGTQAGIAVLGMYLASTVRTGRHIEIACVFIFGMLLGGTALESAYGISKEAATPPWAFYSCAITAALWLMFYHLEQCKASIVSLFAYAGENVLLAYLLAGLVPTVLSLVGLGAWYWKLSQPELIYAVTRSVGCAIVVLSITVALNRWGFKVKL